MQGETSHHHWWVIRKIRETGTDLPCGYGYWPTPLPRDLYLNFGHDQPFVCRNGIREGPLLRWEDDWTPIIRLIEAYHIATRLKGDIQ